jgi:hypothetical protein
MPALPVPLDPGFRAAPEAAIASPALGADNKTYLGDGPHRASGLRDDNAG